MLIAYSTCSYGRLCESNRSREAGRSIRAGPGRRGSDPDRITKVASCSESEPDSASLRNISGGQPS